MMEANISYSHYSLLIGINCYEGEDRLYGCVRDVQMIREHLNAQSTPIHIDILVTMDPSDQPADDPTIWPTYENVTASMKRIAEMAEPGSYVYIHYSGHGTRMEASFPYGNTSTGDLALVLLEREKDTKIRYLSGAELAKLLDTMVQKGIIVNIVLDCCFSGGVLRDGSHDGIRFLPYDKRISEKYPPINAGDGKIWTSITRDGSMLPNWLLAPEGYTILTACGPHEKAMELQFEPGNKRGVLSYFLLRTLTTLGSIRTRQEEIYAHLCARFHAKWPKQSPMLYGNKDLGFFGPLISPGNSTALTVFRGDRGELFLRAGQAHGAYNDDVYALYSYKPTTENNVDTGESDILGRIVESRAVLSILKAIDGSDIPAKVETGWNAKAVTQINLENVPIRLVASPCDQESWFRMGVEYPSVSLHMSEEAMLPFLFHLVQRGDGQYEIQNESCKRIFEPIAISDDPGDRRRVFDTLQHLTRFKHIEAIENRHASQSFEESFTIQIRDSAGKLLDTANYIEVNHGEELNMTLHNHSQSTVCVHLYNMGATWKIQNLQKASYTVLVPTERPGKPRKHKLKMIVPDELKQQGQRNCIDIIKVFITSQPTSMWMLELNPLHDISRPKSAYRGIHELPRFLSSLSFGTLRGGEDQTEENWSTRNIRVRTTIQDHT